MKVHRYSEHQRQMWVHEMVHKTKTIKAICGEAEISRATLYNWLNEYNAAKKETETKAAEDTVASSSLSWQPNDKYKMLLSALIKTDADKNMSRRLARELVKRYNLTTAQACALVSMPEEAYGYRPRKPEVDNKDVYAALVQVLEEQPSRSLEDCIAMLQPLHPHWAIKQIKRIYRQGRLYLKRSRVRRIQHLPQEIIIAQDEIIVPLRLMREGAFWQMGLIQEGNLWLLFLLDYNDGTPLNSMVGEGQIQEADVMQFVTKAATENGLPKKLRIPAMSPFTNRDVSKWSWENRVAIYNLSMAKPENILEMEYIQNDIKKLLCMDEQSSISIVQNTADKWLSGFADNSFKEMNSISQEIVAGSY